jgi:hypothetical protein
MRIKRTILSLGLVAFLTMGFLSVAIYCQEKPKSEQISSTLSSRLREFKFVGVLDDGRRAMILSPMTEEQEIAYKKAASEAFEFDKPDSEIKKAAIKKFSEDEKRKKKSGDGNAIPALRGIFPFEVHYGHYMFGTRVCRVLRVEANYIEVLSMDQPERHELIPLRHIDRVVLHKELPKFELRAYKDVD